MSRRPRRLSTFAFSGVPLFSVRCFFYQYLTHEGSFFLTDLFKTGLLGAARGLDEGLVGGMVSMQSFKDEFHLEEGSESHQADVLSNITSMVQLGSIVGSLLAFFVCDRVGRVRTLQLLSALWLIGFIIVVTSQGNTGQLIAGRFFAGLGIGMTTVVGPTYIAEVAPKANRGMLTNVFAGSVYLGATISFISNWRASANLPSTSTWQWRAPQFVHIGFSVSPSYARSITCPVLFIISNLVHDRPSSSPCLSLFLRHPDTTLSGVVTPRPRRLSPSYATLPQRETPWDASCSRSSCSRIPMISLWT